jgi:hypothetical protein
MSQSINKLLDVLSKGQGNVKQPEGELFNPDLPSSKDFDEAEEIRTKAYSALRLTDEPRNGGYFRLGKNQLHIDPRRADFLMENSIDPNTIRKRVDPDNAIPNLKSGETSLYSLVPENIEATNNVGLIQQARRSYANYKNRFELPAGEKIPEGTTPQPGVTTAGGRMTIRPRNKGSSYLPTDTGRGDQLDTQPENEETQKEVDPKSVTPTVFGKPFRLPKVPKRPQSTKGDSVSRTGPKSAKGDSVSRTGPRSRSAYTDAIRTRSRPKRPPNNVIGGVGVNPISAVPRWRQTPFVP